MFEKEAEEWVKENMDCCKTDNSVNQSIPYFDEEERCCAKSAFQDGAEFGYNSAMEWHFVKDGDLPKEYDTVLACTEFEQHKSYLICNYHYKKWWYADGKYDEDVIAWMYLPELPKESE